LTYSAQITVGGSPCPPSVIINGGTAVGINTNPALDAYKFCSSLQPGQLITIGGNVSIPPLAKNTCFDSKGQPTPPLQTGIPNADISIAANSNLFCSGTVTDATGNYTSCSVPRQNYSVRATKKCITGKYNGCLSTADIVAISKHYNNVLPFTQPWQFIAADVNQNGLVTFDPANTSNPNTDAGVLSQAILGTKPLSNCWVFYPTSSQSNYVLAAATSPAAMYNLYVSNGNSWSQAVNLIAPNANVTNADFYGVQIGDVNGSCYCSGGLMKPSKEKEDTKEYISITDFYLKNGNTYNIPFTNTASKPIMALDIVVNLDPAIDFQGVSSTLPKFNTNSYSWDEENHILHILWLASGKNTILRNDENLFSINIKANDNIKTSEAISIDNYYQNLIYGIENDSEIKIAFKENNVIQANIDIQALPKDLSGSISVYDIYGRIQYYGSTNVSEINNLLNEIHLIKGMYLYQFDAGNSKFSGKFIFNR
jgi:hypothetical protein